MEHWNFPSNGDGQIRGAADAGIETFSGDEIKALAREICQNSLDASNGDGTVRVEFELKEISTEDIPGYDTYKEAISSCLTYWSNQSEKAEKFYREALEVINSPKVLVLRVSDYKTVGLAKPYDKYEIKGWNSLIKVDGGATKSGDLGGSFGIGKNAPFCTSKLRLVFYRTLNMEGERATQGVSRLASFPMLNSNGEKIYTTGIGYYGADGNMPIAYIDSLETLNQREETGTDIFIYGFSGDKKKWEKEVCKEILENFLIAIHNRNLEVKVQDIELNADTYEKYIIDNSKKDLKITYSFYKVLVDENTKEFEKSFHDMGTFRLNLLVDTNEQLTKKVLVVRRSGMKILNIERLSPYSMAGILRIEGEELNKYFREMESPAHDKGA